MARKPNGRKRPKAQASPQLSEDEVENLYYNTGATKKLKANKRAQETKDTPGSRMAAMVIIDRFLIIIVGSLKEFCLLSTIFPHKIIQMYCH